MPSHASSSTSNSSKKGPSWAARGVTKPDQRGGAGANGALAAAIAAKKKAFAALKGSRGGGGASSSSSKAPVSAEAMAFLLERTSDGRSETAELLDIVRECVDEADGGAISLSDLGMIAKDKAQRKSLASQASAGASAVQKDVRPPGGWEAFIAAQAGAEFVVVNGAVQRRPRAMVAAHAAMAAAAASAAVTRAEVNALSFDTL